MAVQRFLALFAMSGLAILSACGGGGKQGSSSSTQGTTTTSPASLLDATAGQTGTTKASRARSLDVCSLLTEADAADVAGKAGLGGAGTSYKLTATKVDKSSSSIPMSSCKFNIEARSGGGGTVEIEVVSGDNFAIYKAGGKPVPGLGDEAVKTEGTTVVRVGDLMLETSENSFTDKFATELYRKIIPKLK